MNPIDEAMRLADYYAVRNKEQDEGDGGDSYDVVNNSRAALLAHLRAHMQGPNEVIVPKKPTFEMLCAATEEWGAAREEFKDIWSAMLSAAPRKE